MLVYLFFFSSRRRHTRSVSAFLLNRSSDLLAAIAYPTTKIRVNATCRKCPHKVHRMEMKTAISCTILRHTKILIAVGRSEERFRGMPRPISYAVFCLKKKKTSYRQTSHNGQLVQHE